MTSSQVLGDSYLSFFNVAGYLKMLSYRITKCMKVIMYYHQQDK